jgi:hypothetical protein
LPEGVQPDAKTMGQYTELLGKHKLPQEAGQELMDLYVSRRQADIEALAQHQHEVFSNTRKEWVQRYQDDPEIGRNRADTTIQNALWAIGEFGGNEAQVKELREMLSYTGAGDHPALIRFANNVAQKMRERPAPAPALPPRADGGPSPESKRYRNM